MGQITSATIKMIRDCISRGEHPPLTAHEIDQLATAWERGQPAVGEEIHVHIEGLDVLTLPLAPSGMVVPRFVVHVPVQSVAQDREDAAFEAVRQQLCRLPRYSFFADQGGVRRSRDSAGNWLEFDQVHALFDPVSVGVARAAKEAENETKENPNGSN